MAIYLLPLQPCLQNDYILKSVLIDEIHHRFFGYLTAEFYIAQSLYCLLIKSNN